MWGSKEYAGIYLQLRKDKKKLRHNGRKSSAEGEKWSESMRAKDLEAKHEPSITKARGPRCRRREIS